MHFELLTNTGDGGAEVKVCAFVSDDPEDGIQVWDLEVYFKERDIFDALSRPQVSALESEIKAACTQAAQESKADLAIERYIGACDDRLQEALQ